MVNVGKYASPMDCLGNNLHPSQHRARGKGLSQLGSGPGGKASNFKVAMASRSWLHQMLQITWRFGGLAIRWQKLKKHFFL